MVFQPRRVDCGGNLRGHGILTTGKLALDLLTSPASSLDGARREVAVALGFLDHSGYPVLTESVDQLAIGVGIGKITIYVSSVSSENMADDLPNDAHARAQQTFALRGVTSNHTEELEDGGHILLQGLG